MNRVFSKIWIIVIVSAAIIGGGILAWQYSGSSYKEVSEISSISNSVSGLFNDSFQKNRVVLCVDTDNGLNYDVAGTVTYKIGKYTRTYYDKCLTFSRWWPWWPKYNLLEYYCKDNKVQSKKYICPEGCQDGACIVMQKCEDGTLYGQCSSNKPKHCDQGVLKDNCKLCGCPTGYECQEEKNTCQKEAIIEIQDNLVILKNKDDVTYTYEACELPGKIAVSDAKVMQHFYTKFDDNYDYAIIFTNFEVCQAIHQINIKNEIKGIGLSEFDNSQYYGSEGRLKGVVRMGQGINDNYLFLHEFGHNWGVFINSELRNEFNHWKDNAFLDRCDAMSATGSYYDEIGNGTYSLHQCHNEWEYSRLTQYLMGLLSKEDLLNDTFHLMEWDNDLSASKIKETFTINDIISLNGERIPTPTTSQKVFNVASILVTDENGASPETIASIQQTMQNYAKWFSEATDNRASINFSIR